MTENERFREMIKYLKENRYIRNQQDFSERVNSDKSTVSLIMNDRISIPNNMFVNISNAFQFISIEWLKNGIGEITGNNTNITNYGRPYYNVDFECGFDSLINDQTIIPEYNISYPPYNKEGIIWCNATGQSMVPEINPGDIIALQEVKNWKDYITYGETYAIVTSNNLRTIKKIRKGRKKDTILLVPINHSEYDDQEIPITHITRIFRVLAAIKKF